MKTKHEFKLGQRVKLISNKDLNHLLVGLTGEIVELTDDDGTATYHVVWADGSEVNQVYHSEIELCQF